MSFENWQKKFLKEILTIVILGKRGSGKSAIGFKKLEYAHENGKNCYTFKFPKPSLLPLWIKNVESIEKIPQDGIMLIDEAGIMFNARNSTYKLNKEILNVLTIARHNDVTTIFVSQNSALLDVGIVRMADTLILKEPSLIQKYFERSFIKKIYDYVSKFFTPGYDNKPYFYILDDVCEGLFKCSVPKFWSENMSKSYRTDIETKESVVEEAFK